MKDRFIPFKSGELIGCSKCCRNPCDGLQPCTAVTTKSGQEGYFIRVNSSNRTSKHERLLKALLSCVDIIYTGVVLDNENNLTKQEAMELIAIKEKMEGGGK